MKQRVLRVFLSCCIVILLTATAFASMGSTAGEIRITNRNSAQDILSFDVTLSGAAIRGQVFAAVYAPSGQMRDILVLDAAPTVPISIRNTERGEYVKIYWLDRNLLPLACSDEIRANEQVTETYEAFTDAAINLMQRFDGDYDRIGLEEVDNEYALARLIVQSDAPLPDLSAYDIAARITDPDGKVILQFDTPEAAETCAAYLRPQVKYVEPDSLIYVNETDLPDTPLSWGIAPTKLDAYAADLAKRADSQDTPVVVAVVDSGVDANHPLLRDRLLPGYDFIQNDQTPQDECSHGTHVSGTVADGTRGMTNIQILPVRVFDASGYGPETIVSLGIRYAADHGANIINLSLSGKRGSYIDEAVAYALSKNAQWWLPPEIRAAMWTSVLRRI